MRGAKPGERRGGRARGTPNKATVDREAALAAAHRRATDGMTEAERASLSPLDVMLLAMRIAVQEGDWRLATSVAAAAAPYVHPKLAATSVTLEPPDDAKLTDEQVEAELAELDRRQGLVH